MRMEETVACIAHSLMLGASIITKHTRNNKCAVHSMQILTALRGTVKIIDPRWCQNHDYARSEAEGIVMDLTSPRAYNFKLCPE